MGRRFLSMLQLKLDLAIIIPTSDDILSWEATEIL